MYSVRFIQYFKGQKLPFCEQIVVPGLEPALALAGLLDRISRASDDVSYESIEVVNFYDQENEKNT